MTIKELNTDDTILLERKDNPEEYDWMVRVGEELEKHDNWHSAYDSFVDHVKFWLSYYTTQSYEAKEAGLTWTVDQFDKNAADFDRWIEYLMGIEDEPQELNLLGSIRRLGIRPIKKDK